MAKELSDDRKAEPATGAEARVCVAKVMKTNAIESGVRRNRFPWSLEIGFVGDRAGNYIPMTLKLPFPQPFSQGCCTIKAGSSFSGGQPGASFGTPDVRLCANSGAKPDIAGLPSRATSRHWGAVQKGGG